MPMYYMVNLIVYLNIIWQLISPGLFTFAISIIVVDIKKLIAIYKLYVEYITKFPNLLCPTSQLSSKS